MEMDIVMAISFTHTELVTFLIYTKPDKSAHKKTGNAFGTTVAVPRPNLQLNYRLYRF
jgi:hypothetical protein